MEAINVLSIGNSFSEDAQRYLHSIAKFEGVDIQTANLNRGGCPLERHYRNIMGDRDDYELSINGYPTFLRVKAKDVLLSRKWDYITVQQASRASFIQDEYFPYVNELVAYIRNLCPKAKILVHQTWGYADNSEKLKVFGFEKYDEMFAKVKECYGTAAEAVGADGIIPSGEALQKALKLGIEKVHRDNAHASMGVGRFIIALTWYKYITGNSIDDIKFNLFDEEVTDKEFKIAIKAVNEVVK
ncbi:MAG: DUF4886 domain-containing protein [Clostridia bacterium]|nr:DUF4886 domain-containing protein [Clostridia bacterium]